MCVFLTHGVMVFFRFKNFQMAGTIFEPSPTQEPTYHMKRQYVETPTKKKQKNTHPGVPVEKNLAFFTPVFEHTSDPTPYPARVFQRVKLSA